MKHFILLLLAVALALTAIPTSATAAPDYNFELVSPRFHYTHNDGGDAIPLEIDFTQMEPGKTYTFEIQRISASGRVLEVITASQVTADSNGEAKLERPFGNLLEGFAYRVRDAGSASTIMNGYVMPPVSADFRSSGEGRGLFEAVAFGDTVYNEFGDDWLFDPEDHTQYLVRQGEYILLHYRLPIATTSANWTIRLAHENTSNEVGRINTDDILAFQGGTSTDHRRAFIVLGTTGDFPAFIDESGQEFTSGTGLDPFRADLDRGVYTAALFKDDDTQRAESQSPLLVGNRSDREFAFSAASLSVRLGSNIRWTFIRETEQITDVFNDYVFLDTYLQETFHDQLLPWTRSQLITYRTDDAIGIGEGGRGNWLIQNSQDWYYGVPRATYFLEFEELYTIRIPAPVQDNLEDFLDGMGLGDTAGQMLFSLVIIIGVVFALAYVGAAIFVLSTVTFGLVGLFAFLGFLPLWLIIGMTMLTVLAFAALFGNGGGGGTA